MTECNATFKFVAAYFLPGADMNAAPHAVGIEITSKPPNTWKKEAQILLKDLNIKKLREVCPFLDMGMSDRAANKLLMQQLESDLQAHHIPAGYYFNEMGAVYLPDGSLGFVRGDTFYPRNLTTRYLVAPEIKNITLCGDGTSPARHILEVLRMLPPQALLTIAYDILISVRSLVIGCGVHFQAVMFITGKSGCGKSRLAKRTVSLYRNKKTGSPADIIEAASTNAATDRILHTMRDTSVAVEDLCLSTGRETARKRREQGARLVRKGTSAVPTVQAAGNRTVELHCNAGIVLTAEFTMETESDISRCLIVPISNCLDLPDELTPELIGDAVRLHSTWFAAHSETELDRLKKGLSTSDWGRNLDPRIRTNYLCLCWAFQSLIAALDHDGSLPSCRKALAGQMDHARSIALEAHMKIRDKLLESVPRGNLAAIIYAGYEKKVFDLAQKPDKLKKHGGTIWKKDLCLKSDALVQFVRTQPGFQSWTRNRITQELKDIGALFLQEEDASTVRIHKGLPRVYRIRLDVLKDMAEYY